MKTLKDLFPGKFLKANDFDTQGVVWTLARLTQEEMKDGSVKPIVYFEEDSRGLVLNLTNGNAIAEITGTDDLDLWTGHQVLLRREKVQFKAERVWAIRLHKPLPEEKRSASGDS